MLENLPQFIGNHPLLSLAFIATLLALIYTEIARRMRGFTELSPQALTQLINRQDATVFDVGAFADFETGHIVGAQHMPPSQADPEANAKLGKLKDQPIALYCKSGQQSEQVATKLTKAGFTQVNWLKGGLMSWREAQLPVTSKKG